MRWLVRLIGVFLGLLAVIVVALVVIPKDRVVALATREFEAATGRALRIEEGAGLSVWPELGVRTGAISIANAGWSDEGPLLKADSLMIGMDLSALMSGNLRMTRLVAERPVILLERAEDGRVNWDLSTGSAGSGSSVPATGGGSSGEPVLSLDLAELADGTVIYSDRGTGERLRVSALNVTARLPEFAGPAEVSLSGRMNDRDFALTGRVSEFGAFTAGRVVPLRLSLATGTARIAFDGNLGTAPLVADGTVDADLEDLSALAALLGRPRPDIPEGLGRNDIALKGGITLTEEGSLHLREGVVSLDGNSLSVEADLVTNAERPKLSAKVTAGALNLAALGGAGQDAANEDGPTDRGWSTEAIDVSPLGLLDADIALSAGSLDLGTLRLQQSRVLITLERSRAVFDIREIRGYDGTLAGELVVNGRGGLSVGGDLALDRLAMQPLLADIAETDRLIGSGDLRLKFLASGSSQDALMRSLTGQGSLRFGKGELRGLDLAGMLRTLDAGYVGEGSKTIFDSVTGSFSIDQGILTSEDLLLAAPLLRAAGSGTVGIGQQDLDYRLLLTALPREDGTGGLSVPLIVTGPWSDPRYRLDVKALVTDKMEEDAKARLAAEAADRLGVVQQEGESLEDAAKRRAREALEAEAGRALNRLFGGD